MPVDMNEAIRLGFLLHDVARLQRVLQDRLLKPLGLTRSQWSVLTFLSRRDGMTQTALAADLDITKAAIGGLLERMEAAGVVQRRSDRNDARIRRVYLTRAGQRLLKQIRGVLESVGTKALGSNTEEEIAKTIGTLRRMKSALVEIIGEEEGDVQENEHAQLIKRA